MTPERPCSCGPQQAAQQSIDQAVESGVKSRGWDIRGAGPCRTLAVIDTLRWGQQHCPPRFVFDSVKQHLGDKTRRHHGMECIGLLTADQRVGQDVDQVTAVVGELRSQVWTPGDLYGAFGRHQRPVTLAAQIAISMQKRLDDFRARPGGGDQATH